MQEMKSVQKSVRLTPSVYKMINEYRGDGFNEKLCNLVEDFIEKHDMLVNDWNALQAAVGDKHAELRTIQQRVQRAREFDKRFSGLVDALSLLLQS